ncbi:MAG: hypothetical protein U5N27_24335 [Rhizobium sp.]|nr:hypothetical protein [Rhizobium sp.]
MRLSLGLALLSVFTAMIPGVLLGVLAAWRGGFADRAVGAVSEAPSWRLPGTAAGADADGDRAR